jgi:hypothetical protein
MKKLVAVIAAVMMLAGCVSAFAAGNAMTKEEAMKAVLDYSGLTADQVTFTKVEQDYDDGRLEWDIEFVSHGIEFEFEVDMNTGRIREADRDHFDHDDDDRYDHDFDLDDIFDFD